MITIAHKIMYRNKLMRLSSRPTNRSISYKDWIKRDREIGKFLKADPEGVLAQLQFEKQISRKMPKTISKRRAATKKGTMATRRKYSRKTTKKSSTKKSLPTPTIKTPKSIDAQFKDSSNAKHMAVTLKPFVHQKENPHPKIPDGRMGRTLGRRWKQVTPVAVAANTAAHIFIYPSFGVIAQVTGDLSGPSVLTDATTTTKKHLYVMGTSTMYLQHYEGVGAAAPTWDGQQMYVRNSTYSTSRRIVSQGLRISSLNDDQRNDGWWEAYRLPVRRIQDGELCLINPNQVQANPDGAHIGFVNLSYTDPPTSFGTQMAQKLSHPGYKTGLIRDLHKVEFNLKHRTHERDPTPALSLGGVLLKGPEYVFAAQAVATPTTSQRINEKDVDYVYSPALSTNRRMELKNTPIVQNLFEQNFDFGMDILVVTLYAGASGSNFLLEGIQNIEYEYQADAEVAPYASENHKYSYVDDTLDESGGDPAPDDTRRG